MLNARYGMTKTNEIYFYVPEIRIIKGEKKDRFRIAKGFDAKDNRI